jgi:hypothetical protein
MVQLRIVDESGENYLYPKASFQAITLPQAFKKTVKDSSSPLASASDKVAAPAILAEHGADFPLASQSDHQTKRLLHRLLLGCLAGSLRGFCHQSIIDFDSRAHQ